MLTILTNKQIWQERSLNARKQLRETLSKARETAKMTQQNLADAIGVGLRTIGDAESGEGNPEFDTLFRIVRFLHIPGDAIFYPESMRDERDAENEHLLAYRQLQARIATCDEQEILLLNAITEAALRVVRCKDTESVM